MPNRKFQELLDEMPAARRKKIAKRVEQALAAMPLDELRRARKMTQVALAQTLGVNQGEVSKIEHRTDVYLSTLASYVEALGGRLEVRAVFRDREMRISQFEGLSK
jgi:DNA-binding XRE family transcriptional regulator